MRQRAAFGLMVASGFAGLGYQIVWTQQCALWLGHEAAAVLAVVTAFFGGLALGAFAVGARVQRSARPERWYAACEALIAVWSAVLALLLAPVSQWMLEWTGSEPSATWQWAVAFGGTFIVLLPATAAMGATLPAMERVVATMDRGTGRIAALYASNTLGAVLGVLACAFWLIPRWGLTQTAAVCALLNVLCALAAMTMSTAPAPGRSPTHAPMRRSALGLLTVTGLLGIGFEVVVVRVLSQVAEDTVYTFALLLAVYLLGTALGAAAYRRRWPHGNDSSAVQGSLLCLQAAACLIGALSLWAAESVRHFMLGELGLGMAAALAAEAALALLAFAAPTLVMGALFSHLAARANSSGNSLGLTLGCNTVGAAAAPAFFGVILTPAFGPKWVLLLIVAGYLALAWPAARRRAALWVPATAAAMVAWLTPTLAFVDVPEGGRVVSYLEGTTGAVSVVEDGQGVARLRINNRQQEGSSATVLADARQALLPLLLHPAPQRALFLGLGTGVTAWSAAMDPSLQVDAVELLPEVIQASRHFTRALDGETSGGRPRLIAADARRFVRTTERRYDVIVADNFHPARSGSGALHTVEHFRAVRDRLSDRGVFFQWLPLHQLDLDTLRSIVRSFVAANPTGWAMLATHSLETPVLGLVARREDGVFDLQTLRERLAHSALPQRLADFGLADELALLGGIVAGPQSLIRFAGDAPINTDDQPVVAYRAPRITYAPDSLPRERLATLLRELRVTPLEVIKPDDEPAARRLAAYWAARDRFVEAGMTVRASTDPRRMLDQVREPLLAVLRISPDFRPAYDPLLRMAVTLAHSNSIAAKALLAELKRLQPQRREAQDALDRLAASSN